MLLVVLVLLLIALVAFIVRRKRGGDDAEPLAEQMDASEVADKLDQLEASAAGSSSVDVSVADASAAPSGDETTPSRD